MRILKRAKRFNRKFFMTFLVSLIVFCVMAAPCAGVEYIVFSRARGFKPATDNLKTSVAEKLSSAGIPMERFRHHFRHLNAVTLELKESEAETLRNEDPDAVLIKSGLILYPATGKYSQSEITPSETPWHVLRSAPLSDYASDTGADLSSVFVFVLDTGVDADHPDLTDGLEMAYARHFYDSFLSEGVQTDTDVQDRQGHGSEVTGTIIGKFTGVAPDIKAVPVKCATDTGALSEVSLLTACDYIMGLKAGDLSDKNIIINLSYNSGVFAEPDTNFATLFDNLFESLKQYGILFIGSSGNEYRDSNEYYIYPTRNESNNYLSVASVRSDGRLSGFSNYGDLSVEIAAPGSSIITTDNNGGYVDTPVDGTSFSSPFASGIAGLIWAIDPSLKYWEVRNLIINAVGGKSISTSFIEDFSGTSEDYTGLLESSSLSSYEYQDVAVISGKALLPAIVTGSSYGSAPSDGEEHVPFDSNLQWENSLEGASFDLWFGEARDNLSLVSGDLTAKAFNLENVETIRDSLLEYKKSYYWRVDTGSDSIFSQGRVWRFTTLTPEAYDNHPVDGDIHQDIDLKLSWTSDLEDSTFDVYLDADKSRVTGLDAGIKIASDISASQLTVNGLEYETKYYWRVVTHFSDPERNLYSSQVEGEVVNFMTKTKDEDNDLYASGGGGGGCVTGPSLPGLIILMIPLLILKKY